jgi:putative hydrolase of the HAD superfamily
MMEVNRSMPYSTLVFDFFGVICSEVAPHWLAKYLSRDEALEIKDTVVDAADRGVLSQEALFSTLAKRAHVTPEQVEREWVSYVHIDSQIVSLIEKLRPKVKLGLLTNSPAPFVRRILTDNDLERLFDSIVVSSEHGCAKPDAAIYKTVLNDLHVKSENALMIDDNPTNVAGAIAIGMGGLLFESAGQLDSALVALSQCPAG